MGEQSGEIAHLVIIIDSGLCNELLSFLNDFGDFGLLLSLSVSDVVLFNEVVVVLDSSETTRDLVEHVLDTIAGCCVLSFRFAGLRFGGGRVSA